ncbi:MAG: hypothetical protein O2857_26355 [Planctomycetota bacterium]|nr:hypothetical protein [Planctomycetota bacterium]
MTSNNMEKRITREELRKEGSLFNQNYLSSEELKKLLADSSRSFYTEGDLSDVPEKNNGLTICITCNKVYWVTGKDPVQFTKRGKERRGPYCSGDIYQAFREN